jgi:AraC family transcriptional regulator
MIWGGGAAHLRASQDAPGMHAHFAIQLSLGFAGDLSLRCTSHGPETSASGWLIRSDQPHCARGAGVGVTFFWSPVSSAGRIAATRVGNKEATPLSASECAYIRRELEGCWERGWLHTDLRGAADRIASYIATPGATAPPLDRRVQMVLKALRSDPTGKSSLAELAELARISESRLAHLFRRDVGLPVRQYRLTLRMEEAVREIAGGASLSRAAYAAGFADPAHFCRICRRMFGSAPSHLPTFQLER